MSLFLMLLAAGFAALTNYFMRKSLDSGGTTRGYLAIQMAVALLLVLVIGPFQNSGGSFCWQVAMLGILSGLILALMLYSLGKALEKGPSGLTFSILSSSTVMPSIVLAVLYGKALGCHYSLSHAVGSVLVVLGLFWAGKGLGSMQDKGKWVQFCTAMFLFHVALLVIFQWKGILANLERPESIMQGFTKEAIQSPWYLPMLYLTASIFQLSIYLKKEKRRPMKQEWICGIGGGIGNGFCTFLMTLGSDLALPMERAVMFPLFSIGTIVFSNLWSQILYKEKINWKASQLCAFGILVGTVNWGMIREFSSDVFWQKQSTAQKEERRQKDASADEVSGDVSQNHS